MTRRVKLAIQAARAALNTTGGSAKSIWITEIGWPVEHGDAAHETVSATVQKERLESVFEMIKNHVGTGKAGYDIESLLWYNIEDVAGTEWAAHCGLLTRTGQRRSAFGAFRDEVE